MQTFINGAKYAFSTTLAEAIAITAITNAAAAVASTATLPNDGDIVLLNSNWTDLNELATYADNPTAGTFTLSGVDTSDESLFVPDEELPASYQVAGDFVNLSQIREITQSGGDTNTFNWGYIDDRSPRQRSKPTDQNPLTLTFTMDYDPTLPWDAALYAVSKARQLVVMRERLPTGDVLLYTGYLSYQKSPSRTRNENMTVTATMSINSEILRFPAAFFAGS
jgi:hypothetical protein